MDDCKIQPQSFIYGYASTKLNLTKFELLDHRFDFITNSDIDYYHRIDETKIITKIELFTQTLRTVQNKFTRIKKNTGDKVIAHPWTHNRKYKVLLQSDV